MEAINREPLKNKNQNLEMLQLEFALNSLQVQATNFGSQFIKDSRVRFEYEREIKRVSDMFLEKVRIGELTPSQAATYANQRRNEIMEIKRKESSKIGRAWAKKNKPEGLTLKQLTEEKSIRKYHRPFELLNTKQKEDIYNQIIRSAGRDRSRLYLKLSRTDLSRIGRGLIAFSLGVTIYNIYTANDKVKALGKEGVIIGGGFLGSMAGGAVAGLACGPGAPVCVTLYVFVGGIIGNLGSDSAFDIFFD